MAELILAFREPAGSPLRVVDRLDLAHVAWCLLVGSAGLRVTSRGLDRVLLSKVDELVGRSGHERRPAAPALDRQRAIDHLDIVGAAPVQHHPVLGLAPTTITHLPLATRL